MAIQFREGFKTMLSVELHKLTKKEFMSRATAKGFDVSYSGKDHGFYLAKRAVKDVEAKKSKLG